jgi:hypothetical protein
MTPETLLVLNLVISGIALPLLGWMLRELYSLSKHMSAANVTRISHDHEIVDLRTRLDELDTGLRRLEIEIVKLKEQRADSTRPGSRFNQGD